MPVVLSVFSVWSEPTYCRTFCPRCWTWILDIQYFSSNLSLKQLKMKVLTMETRWALQTTVSTYIILSVQEVHDPAHFPLQWVSNWLISQILLYIYSQFLHFQLKPESLFQPPESLLLTFNRWRRHLCLGDLCVTGLLNWSRFGRGSHRCNRQIWTGCLSMGSSSIVQTMF